MKQVKILSKLLESHLKEKAIQSANRRFFYLKQYLSPSMDLLCLKKTFFNVKLSGPKSLPVNKKDFTYKNERAKDNGNKIHDSLQNAFKDMGILKFNELTMIDEEHKIKARLDSLVEINGELYLVEIKSSKSYAVKLMQDEGASNIEHLKQIQIYFHLLELNKNKPEIYDVLKGREVNKGIIFYENKNDHEPLEFLVYKNQAIIDKILQFAKSVWKHVEENKEPKFTFDKDSSECMYCPYYEKCHGEKKQNIAEENKNIWGYANVKEVGDDPKF